MIKSQEDFRWRIQRVREIDTLEKTRDNERTSRSTEFESALRMMDIVKESAGGSSTREDWGPWKPLSAKRSLTERRSLRKLRTGIECTRMDRRGKKPMSTELRME